MVHKQPPGLEPGVYFNLSNDAYHADSSLSHSGMVDILESPLDYWMNGPLNPDRKPFKVSDAMKLGVWSEDLLLEEKNFFEKYKVSGTDFHSKKQVIPRTDWEKVQQTVKMIRSVPEADAYFKNGYPQVSIIFVCEETGIRLRIRVDYLRFFGGIDYKRIKAIHGGPLGWIITDYGFDIQDRLYRTGILAAKIGLRNGTMKAHGKYDSRWLAKFVEDKRALFTFCFQRSSAPFPFVIQPLEQEILNQAQVQIYEATMIYKRHIEAFGKSQWPAGRVLAEPFSIFHLPKRYFDRGTHQI